MDYTVLTNLRLTGALKAEGGVSGALTGCVKLSKAADYTLTADERSTAAVCAELTAASKALTLGIAEGQVLFVVNTGSTNAFTLKGRTGDTGTSLGAGKAALVIGSETADATKIYVLN